MKRNFENYLVVVAMASVRAFHATVASKKVTAHTQSKAVSLVGAKEFARPHCRDKGPLCNVGGGISTTTFCLTIVEPAA